MAARDLARRVASCRSCGGAELEPVLSLGETPIANALLRGPDEPSPRHPLEIGLCPACALVQLLVELPADAIFDDEYPYYSSFSDALRRHAATYARRMIEERGLGPSSLVVELASNDGYLLREFVEAGVRVVGIDPSPGPAEAAEAVGVPTIVDFFGSDLAARIVEDHGRADLVVANNVMAHVPDLNDFVGGMAMLLADDGLLTVENPSVGDLVAACEFDTIYHEHYCYFSTIAVDRLMWSKGLSVNAVERFPELHGGTLRWHVERDRRAQESVLETLLDERRVGLHRIEAYRAFAARVEGLQSDLRTTLHDLKRSGATIAAYGAAAKGATLLNSAGIDHEVIDFVVDRNVHKQGRWMPGARLPILDPAALVERRPDYTLLLAWNFADEIVGQQQDYREAGGRFIVPVPEVRILA